MPRPTPTRVYLSADALFDLRLGTLVTISPEFAFEVTKGTDYFKRTIDRFSNEKYGDLDPMIFDEIQSKCGPAVLKNSLITKILPFVTNLLVEILKQVDKLSLSGPLELDVNLYPFVFSDEEAKELLTLLVYKIGKIASINLVSIPPDKLTIEHVRDTYLAVVMYRYHDWFNLHNDDLQKITLRNTGFYLPRINFVSDFTEEQTALFKKHGADAFDLITKALKYFVNIQYAPVALYCADLPHNPG